MEQEAVIEKCCVRLAEKVQWLDRFGQATVKLKDELASGNNKEMALHVKKRQGIINRVQSIDRELSALTKNYGISMEMLPPNVRVQFGEYLDQITQLLQKVKEMDRECLALATGEFCAMQSEIVQARSGLQAARGYGRTRKKTPRFLDLKR
jgi:hypothetical protein